MRDYDIEEFGTKVGYVLEGTVFRASVMPIDSHVLFSIDSAQYRIS